MYVSMPSVVSVLYCGCYLFPVWMASNFPTFKAILQWCLQWHLV